MGASLDSIPIVCVHCQTQGSVSFETIDSRGAIKCPACGKTFAIGDVFQSLYENEQRVKKSIDSLASYATSQWRLKADDPDARKAVEGFLPHAQFEDLLGRTAVEILVHGDTFLHVAGKGWRPLPAQQVRVKTSLAPQHGSKALFLKDDEFVLTTEKGTESFGPEEVVHFKKTLLSQETPYGESKLLVTLTALNNLRALRSAPLGAQAEFQWFHDHLEEEVRMGLGVPDFVLEKQPLGYDRRVAEFATGSFVGEVGELQGLLSSGFDEALARFASQRGLTEAPKLQLRKLTLRQVLLDCGFNFSKDMETLRQLHQLGIITKEQLDKMLSEYKP